MDITASLTADLKPRRRRRLTQTAYAILSKFFEDVSTYPTAAQCEELTDTIRRLPECEWYTVKKVRSYFFQKRCYEGRKQRVKAEPSSPPPLPPPSLASLIAGGDPVPKDEDDGALERVPIPARESPPKTRKPREPVPLILGTQRTATETTTTTMPVVSEQTAPVIDNLNLMPANAVARPQLYFYPFPMVYPSAHAPLTHIYGAAHAELPQYTWLYPSTPSPPFHFAASRTSTIHAPTPVSTLVSASTLLSSTISRTDPRLSDLAARLADALTDPGSAPPLADLPKTPADLMRRLGDQQASEDFLRGIRGGVYARLGLFPMDALRTARPLVGVLTH
ncbi:hypothetical protein C8T65DRAFT_832606 [Cerioporus squamosus]|nr:hypothetical protein C8T65DRAFT_832606 [Cerioporus squamosus]